VEKENRKVVTSKPFDFIDIPSIHKYGWATFGLKLADYFIADIYASIEDSNQLFTPSRVSSFGDQN
jgi:hypothetical protein